MIEMVQNITPVPLADGAEGPDRTSAAAAAGPPDGSASRPGTRLYVEQDGKGVFVYRLVDVATGRLLAEVPREQADTLKASPDYAAGALVSARV